MVMKVLEWGFSQGIDRCLQRLAGVARLDWIDDPWRRQ